MGRQAYLNRLALGRSPYEAPEDTNDELTGPSQRSVSALHGDGYAQQYDERGHPVNQESKSLGRDLRRAKNDILSTMGIVVSSKDGKSGIASEKHNTDMIAAENDYGLIVATLDQALVFLGSWWTTSLIGRIQTFKRYAHAPLMKFINAERASIGVLGFYFSGIPAWAISTGVSICRHNPLESLISTLQEWLLYFSPGNAFDRLIRRSCSLFHSATRGALLVVAVQAYMYSLLQSLHLVHPYSLPGWRLLIPFSELTSVHLPSFPAELTLNSLSTFGLNLLTTPPLLVYLSFYLRPVFEIRLYRLIRRRLPKPTYADEASIKVAYDNDLIDWMVPSLGRRSDEEISRTRLTLVQDIITEASHFKWWALSWFGIKPKPKVAPDNEARRVLNQYEQRIESLLHWAEELRSELRVAQSRGQLRQQRVTDHQDMSGAQTPLNREQARSTLPDISASAQAPEPAFDSARAVPNGDIRISHSPEEISEDDLAEMPPLGRTRSAPSIEPTNRDTHRGVTDHTNRRHSRTNTLFSRPSSPESSPPTSPRVRASLIHQNSDIITMQLELLSHRNSNNQDQATARDDRNDQTTTRRRVPDDRRSIAEFLDSLISNQGHLTTTLLGSDAVDSDGLSGLTAAVSPVPGTPADPTLPRQNTLPENPIPNLSTEPPVSSIANVLPDDVEEPPAEPVRTQSEAEPTLDETTDLEPLPMHTSISAARPPNNGEPHRVTILSSHPLDSLASHLASVITTVMFLPLESIFLRSLATSFLASQGTSLLLRSDVRRPLGFWVGGGSRSDIIPYLGKLGLAVGLQAAVNASVWGVVTGAVIRIGKTFCNWGSL